MSHRSRVGGLWDVIGKLQYNFMVNEGLRPDSKLLDIGCGCLRGGIHFIKYLDNGNYYGVDKDPTLLKAGMKEAKMASVGHKLFHLELDSGFNFAKLETVFDFVLAQSVFTHINLNEILLCLIRVSQVLNDNGRFYATYFPAAKVEYDSTIEHKTVDGKTVKTLPAFSRSMHYTLDMLQWAANQAGLECKPVIDWEHPRRQKMVVFYK